MYLFADALLPCDVQMGQEEKKCIYRSIIMSGDDDEKKK